MIIGLLRIKNEARWIERVVRSIQPVCGRNLIFDDHSTEGTPEVCVSRHRQKRSPVCPVERLLFRANQEHNDHGKISPWEVRYGSIRFR
jgi:glycosyltransferase involved in cell wall biosynthesis